MNKKSVFISSIVMVFLLMELSYVGYPTLYKITDDKITSLFLKSQSKQEVSKHVSIVDIDAPSIEKIGQWPFSRDIISQALINLTNAGAGIIGFDIVFSNPDRLSPHSIAKQLELKESYPNYDELFANTLKNTPVILGYYFDMSNHIDTPAPKRLANINIENSSNLEHFNEAKSLVDNIDILKNASYSSGHFNLTNITSGVVDSAPLFIKYQNELYPSLALEMLRITSAEETIKVHNSELGVLGVSLKDMSIPTNVRAEIKLNFRGAAFSYPYLSFYDILTNNFDPKEVEGKFILIGTSDIGLNDLVTTIYDSAMPGVEVHATTIDNILNQDFYHTPLDSYTYGIILIFFSSIVLAFVLYHTPPSLSILSFVLFILLVGYANYYLIFYEHIIIGFSAVFITLFLTTGIFALLSYYYENIQRKRIFNKLSSKVSLNVANELLKHDKDILNVEKKELTVLFSDIRGFTQLSEEIKDPEKLIHILNRYMSPMVDSITQFNGTIDKFIGDAIMAYWNAPLEVENHADLAVQSALRQLEQLDKLNIVLKKEFNIILKIGIGINSGEAIVGEMGSTGRSDYTLIGDTVNLASRVESLTKEYKCSLIITEQTKSLLQEKYDIHKLDTLQVKGKVEKTTIYSVNKVL
ncbi:adenylate/guanylate cyclase domain-containing protein [Sulfurimonas sp.]|nr:adenylate/guanylate cyclase domain-containing protein [Sulfurimonas sp.]